MIGVESKRELFVYLQEWRDERLKWTPAAGNGNIKSVFSTSDIIWKPELVIDNA
ncbi:hypothetical protein DPMN_188069 [Dreissena polymorpha]|uniref:Neurotransmitter-gated ion-channel ligand-binding domain-containing protein n=1 Tax=Dreissena polymorpha TaxID=45954 RepID=A0A9D4DQM1_DREPO|nr:hypothetical protein DPMN_188069 [Dreissena polymorpha]